MNNTKKRKKRHDIIFTVSFLLSTGAAVGFGAGFTAAKCVYDKPEAAADFKPLIITALPEETAPEPEETAAEYVSAGTFTLTAYCSCEKCCGIWAQNRPKDENGNDIVYTATGAIAEQGKTIAVDPRVIPYGTTVLINGQEYTAQDCGGAIKENKIDVYFNNHADAVKFGVQHHEIFIKCEV